MKNSKMFIIWGVIVIAIIGLLTTLGFMLKRVQNKYIDVEKKIVESTKDYVDYKFLYDTVDKKGSLKITSEELIEHSFLDELVKDDDKCTGYVIVTKKDVYKYKGYVKCGNYTTAGYE